VEFIASPSHGYAPGEIAAHDLAACAVDRVKPRKNPPADKEPTGQSQQNHQPGAPEQSCLENLLELAPFIDVARDEKIKALHQLEDLTTRPAQLCGHADPPFVIEFHQSIGDGADLGPGIQIARNHAM